MSLFGSSSAKPAFGSTQTSTPSLFGNTTTSASAGTLFGATASVAPTTTASTGGLFGNTSSSGSLFGSKPALGTATSSTTTNLFGSNPATTSSSLFGSKPPFGASATSTNLFGGSTTTSSLFSKPGTTTTGLFSTSTQPQQQTQMRDTIQTVFQNCDALVRSLTNPQLFGDERDNIVLLLNQLAAGLGVGEGYHKDGQPAIKYTPEGQVYQFVGIAYNAVSEHQDSDGIVSIVTKSPATEFITSTQKRNFEDALFKFLGAKIELKPHIDSVRALPDNCTEVCFYVVQKGRGRISSRELCQYLNQNEQKNQIQQQLKVDPTKIVSKTQMSKEQLVEYLKDIPPGIDASIWEQAIRGNPDPARLIPAAVRGFNALKERSCAQAVELEVQEKVMDAMTKRSANHETHLAQSWNALEAARARQKELSFRLLRVLCVQAAEARFSQPIDASEESIGAALENLIARLTAPEQLNDQITNVNAQIKDAKAVHRSNEENPSRNLTIDDMIALKRYLARCQDGLETLQQMASNNLEVLQLLLKQKK